MSKQYWKGIEELRNDAEFVRLKNNEFFEHLPVGEQLEKKATANGAPASWGNIDSTIGAKLTDIAAKNGNIRILSSTIISPSTKKIIEEFSKKYPGTKQVTYDSISYSGMIKANKESFGIAAIPSYRFDNADVIVSFGADFLTNWLSPIEFAKQYGVGRKLNEGKKKMSKNINFEPTLSVTVSNADKRIPVKPTQMPVLIANLYNEVAKQTGGTTISAPDAGDL